MNIFSDGFKIGNGSNYGPGVYAFYDINDIINDSDYSTSKVIIECDISDLSGFLITNPIVAKKVFGEFDIGKQISNIMGEKWVSNNMKSTMKIIEDKAALPYNFLGKELKGWIFDPGPDRDVCWVICYDTSLIIPKRFSKDLGQTWETP